MWSGLNFSSSSALPSAVGCEDANAVVTACSSQAAYFAGDVYRSTLQVQGPESASASRPISISVSAQLCGVLSTSTSRRDLLHSPALNRYRHAALPFYVFEGKGGGAAACKTGVSEDSKTLGSSAIPAASAYADRLPVCPVNGGSGVWNRDPVFSALFSSNSKLLFLSEHCDVTDNLVFDRPGVTFSFGYECRLPSFLPPTFNGSTTKINYYLCVTSKKSVSPHCLPGIPGSGCQLKPTPLPSLSTSFFRLPIRLLGSPNRHMPILPTLGPPVLPAPPHKSAQWSAVNSSGSGSGWDVGSSAFPPTTKRQTPSSEASSVSSRSRFFLPNVFRVFGAGGASSSSRPSSVDTSLGLPTPPVPFPTPAPISFHFHSRTWMGGDLASQMIKSVDPAALDDRFLPECLGSDISWLLGAGRRGRDAFSRETLANGSSLSSLSSPPCALRETLGLWNASRNTREYGTAYIDVLCATSVPPLWAGDACGDSLETSKALSEAESPSERAAENQGVEREFEHGSELQAREHRGSSCPRGDRSEGKQQEKESDSGLVSGEVMKGQNRDGSAFQMERSADACAHFSSPDSLPSQPASSGPHAGPCPQEDLQGTRKANSPTYKPSQPSPFSGVVASSLPLLRIVVDGDNDAPFGMPGEAGVPRREQFRISRSGQFLCLVSLPGVPFLSLTRPGGSRRQRGKSAIADPGPAAPCVPVGGSFNVRLSFEGATSRTHEVHLSVVREETPLRPASAATGQQVSGLPAVEESRIPPSRPVMTRSSGGGASSRSGPDVAGPSAPDGPTLAQVVWTQQAVVVSMEEASVAAHVPTACPPSFETDTVRVSYALVFQFLCAGEEAAERDAELGECEATPAWRGKLSRDDGVGLSWELPLIVLPPPFGDGASREDPQEALWIGGSWEAVGDAAGVAAHELERKARAWQASSGDQGEVKTDANCNTWDRGSPEEDHSSHQLQLLYSASGIALLSGDGAKSLHRGVAV
ncbi:hypothetical protein TGGT1_262680 [Toxoplasma gondii GT1]|uniref:Uncharacterized protein n=3 Tax=Toxoplasma gondii TaxID=5811 RepID=S7UXU2_TOXGG|nr:hypothetical protein TGGT1_262680 [Toxoplasma gondii GT1]KAF4641025.1 hypothetical protein TGRH88_068340 [Toxoplasma gondii]RQX71480.1 hypothetical protein TGCAST_262680 [Toxoplasma gondii CAST]